MEYEEVVQPRYAPVPYESINQTLATSGSTEFVKKLYAMVSEQRYPNIVRWTDAGDSFVVIDPMEFAKIVLPAYFKHSNFSSFVRQLNKYDFHKIRNNEDDFRYGENAWEFKHPDFLRDYGSLLENIKRKTVGSSKKKVTAVEPPPGDQGSKLAELEAQLEAMRSENAGLLERLANMEQAHEIAFEQINLLNQRLTSRDNAFKSIVDMIKSGGALGGQEVAASEAATPMMEAPSRPTDQDPTALLVVDDEPDVLRVCTKFLEEFGFKVESTNNGLDAVNQAKQVYFDLILMDGIIRSLDGVSAAKVIRNYGVTSPIVIMTESDSIDQEHYVSQGVSNAIAKPFSKAMLFKVLEGVVDPSIF